MTVLPTWPRMEALTEEFIIYLGCTENFVTKHYNFVGCDGCLNWKGMGFGYSGFPGGTDYLVKDYYPEDKLTFGNNNGLQVREKNTINFRHNRKIMNDNTFFRPLRLHWS